MNRLTRASQKLFPPFALLGFVLYLQKRSLPGQELRLGLRQIKRETGSDIESVRRLIRQASGLGYIKYSLNKGVSTFKILKWV